MKKFIILNLLLMCLPLSSFASDSSSSVGILGARYDNGVIGTVGGGKAVKGNLWMFAYTGMGDNQSAEIEAVYFLKSSSKFKLGLSVGPFVDFEGYGDHEEDGLTYFGASAGAVLSYSFADNIGAWVFGRYKVKGDSHRDKDFVGLGLYFGL